MVYIMEDVYCSVVISVGRGSSWKSWSYWFRRARSEMRCCERRLEFKRWLRDLRRVFRDVVDIFINTFNGDVFGRSFYSRLRFIMSGVFDFDVVSCCLFNGSIFDFGFRDVVDVLSFDGFVFCPFVRLWRNDRGGYVWRCVRIWGVWESGS